MSDQDFFFEDEENEQDEAKTEAKSDKSGSKPAPKTPAKSGTAAKSTTAKSSSTAAKAVASKAKQPAEPSFFDREVTVAIASLVAAIALLLGVVIGYFVFGGTTPTATVGTTGAATQQGGAGSSAAPPLTQDQLNSGQLPQGHPSIGGGTSGSKTATSTGK